MDSTAVSGWSQNVQPRHAHAVAYVVLPDVEPDDGQDLADDADDDEGEPRPARGGGLVSLDRM